MELKMKKIALAIVLSSFSSLALGSSKEITCSNSSNGDFEMHMFIDGSELKQIRVDNTDWSAAGIGTLTDVTPALDSDASVFGYKAYDVKGESGRLYIRPAILTNGVGDAIRASSGGIGNDVYSCN
jgi:hypothetical protein